jgi:ribosomal protein L12E/L44/L45/RPP1/RPP2
LCTLPSKISSDIPQDVLCSAEPCSVAHNDDALPSIDETVNKGGTRDPRAGATRPNIEGGDDKEKEEDEEEDKSEEDDIEDDEDEGCSLSC